MRGACGFLVLIPMGQNGLLKQADAEAEGKT
jgi:hypothetical protein